MASSSKNLHARSNSLPSRSYPRSLRVDEELNKVRVLEASTASTSDSVYKGLSRLEDLFICVDDFLNSASSQHGHEKCLEEFSNESVRLLEVCEVTRDMLVQIKEHAKALQSALRRRKGDSSIQSSISSFISFRKKMKKDVKKLTTTLKQVDSQALASFGELREVSSISASILESLLQFLSVKQKSSRWSLVSKLMQKEKVACEGTLTGGINEIEDVDVALLSLCKSEANNEKIQSVQGKLEALDANVEALEKRLESLIRRMIKTRVSILNILSL